MIPKKCFLKKLFVFICSFKLAISLDSWQTSLFGYCSSSDEEASKFNNLAESLIIVITINVFQVCSQNLKRIEGGSKTIEQLGKNNQFTVPLANREVCAKNLKKVKKPNQ